MRSFVGLCEDTFKHLVSIIYIIVLVPSSLVEFGEVYVLTEGLAGLCLEDGLKVGAQLHMLAKAVQYQRPAIEWSSAQCPIRAAYRSYIQPHGPSTTGQKVSERIWLHVEENDARTQYFPLSSHTFLNTSSV
jgi:hypothetical protein